MISAHGFVAPTMDGGVPPNAALTYPAPMASLPAYGVPAAPNTFSNVEYIPHRVFVGGFSSQTKEDDLRNFFQQFGSIREVKVIRTIQGISKGYGFVTFDTEEEANLDQEKLQMRGRRLNLGPAIRRVGIPRYGVSNGVNYYKSYEYPGVGASAANNQYWPMNSAFGYAYAYPGSPPFLVVSPSQMNTLMFPQGASPPTSPTVGNF